MTTTIEMRDKVGKWYEDVDRQSRFINGAIGETVVLRDGRSLKTMATLEQEAQINVDAAVEAAESLEGALGGVPSIFLNGAFDDSLAGPNFLFDYRPPISNANVIFLRYGFDRWAYVAPGQAMYIEVPLEQPILQGETIAASVLIAQADANGFAALTGKVALLLVKEGDTLGNAVTVTLVDTGAPDFNHRIYATAAPNPYAGKIVRMILTINNAAANVPGLYFAAQAAAVGKAAINGVEWQHPDRYDMAVRVSKNQPITLFGDSLAVFIESAVSIATNRPVRDWAIGSQTSRQAVNRAFGFTMRLANAQITSGANVVNRINGAVISSGASSDAHMVLSGAGTPHSISGYAGSVHGVLTATTTNGGTTWAYRFTADTGYTLPIKFPDDTPFVPDFPPIGPVIASLGRNNFYDVSGRTDFGPDAVYADVVRANAALGERLFVLSIPNSDTGSNEYGPSGGYYGVLAGLNARLAALLGRRFIDNARIKKDRGLQLAGLTPNAQDATDTANDIISNQLRADAIHPNDAGQKVDAGIIRDRLAEVSK